LTFGNNTFELHMKKKTRFINLNDKYQYINQKCIRGIWNVTQDHSMCIHIQVMELPLTRSYINHYKLSIFCTWQNVHRLHTVTDEMCSASWKVCYSWQLSEHYAKMFIKIATIILLLFVKLSVILTSYHWIGMKSEWSTVTWATTHTCQFL
jgi:hypothetical protein